jgi:transcriptional regulator with XRE-family HTH domain
MRAKLMNSAPHPVDLCIGTNLRNYRLLRNMTQTQLGEAIPTPVSFQQIQKYESGANRVSASRLVDFATVLGCQVTQLMEGVELPECNGDVAKLAGMVDALPDEQREIVINLVDALAKQTAKNMRLNYDR